MELSCGWHHIDSAAVVADFGEATRFLGTSNELQDAASRLVQRAVFAARLCLELSAQCLRTLLSRASIRTRHPNFFCVVSRTINRSWNYNRRRHNLLDRPVRCVSASTENVVDLGNCRRRRLLVFFALHRAGIH